MARLNWRPWLLAPAIIALAGCGKIGPLERPGPLVGEAKPNAPEVTARGAATQTVDPRNRSRRGPPPL